VHDVAFISLIGLTDELGVGGINSKVVFEDDANDLKLM